MIFAEALSQLGVFLMEVSLFLTVSSKEGVQVIKISAKTQIIHP